MLDWTILGLVKVAKIAWISLCTAQLVLWIKEADYEVATIALIVNLILWLF